jgi:hypothetical protein
MWRSKPLLALGLTLADLNPCHLLPWVPLVLAAPSLRSHGVSPWAEFELAVNASRVERQHIPLIMGANRLLHRQILRLLLFDRSHGPRVDFAKAQYGQLRGKIRPGAISDPVACHEPMMVGNKGLRCFCFTPARQLYVKPRHIMGAAVF